MVSAWPPNDRPPKEHLAHGSRPRRLCKCDLTACDRKLTGLDAVAADKQSRRAEEREEEGGAVERKKRTQTAEGSITHRVVCRNCD